jgi:hypothetical protein
MNARIYVLVSLLLLALNVGQTTGILSYLAGNNIPFCFMAGAGAFASTIIVGTAIWSVFAKS